MFARKIAAALALVVLLSGIGMAQEFPNKPLTMIIPFAAGGPTDVLGRVVAQRMSEILGQQVIVENVGGADRKGFRTKKVRDLTADLVQEMVSQGP